MKTEVKITTDCLEIGMFVSKIDRPWMELPVLLEGMMIETTEDIKMFKSYCNIVYVDTMKGKSPNPMHWVSDTYEEHEINISSDVNSPFSQYYHQTYETTSPLDKEIKVAQSLYITLNSIISNTFKSLPNNEKLDVKQIEESVITTVESTIRNPVAFRLILELQKQNKEFYDRSLGTSVWCAQIGRQMGLKKEDIYNLAMAGILLDIGKTRLPVQLLNKKGKPSEDEIRLFRSHVDIGVRYLVKQKGIPRSVLQMVATHHERFDGSGYPQGIKGETIPVFGQIAGLADCFDAMISHRPYVNNAHSPHEAIGDLYRLRGILFSNDIIDLFIQTVGVYPSGSLVELKSGEVGLVFSSNHKKRLRPKVLIVLDSEKKEVKNYYQIDLSVMTEYSIRRTLPRGHYNIRLDNIILT